MAVLLLDTETTGTDFEKDRITEVGMMVTSPDFKEVIATFNSLVYGSDYPPLTEEVTKITGITPEMLVGDDVITPIDMLDAVERICIEHGVTHTVAYNAPFDRGMIEAEDKRSIELRHLTPDWVCAMGDVEENYKCKSWKLMHVALDHGVTVNPKELHRAINDVELMRQMLVELGTDINKMVEYRDSPWVYAVALVRPPWEDGGESSGQAKALGFSWQQARGDDSGRTFEKRWVKRLKMKDWDALQENPTVKVRLL